MRNLQEIRTLSVYILNLPTMELGLLKNKKHLGRRVQLKQII
jgi:hypothetical protein